MRFVKFLSSWAPVAVWASLIYYLSDIPGLQTGWGVWDYLLRKGAHITEYAVFTALLLRAFGRTWMQMKESTRIFLVAIAAFLYAVSDEIHQAFVPRRGPSVHDVIVDVIGILLCVIAFRKWRRCISGKLVSFGMLILLSVVVGCSPEKRFSKARAVEKQENYQKAWEMYQEFAAKYPKHPAAAEALFRAGWLSQRKLNDCVMANAFYDTVVQRYPQADPWARHAAYYRNNCPDYFPLVPGFRWVMGDSETHGKNAKVEVACRKPSKSEEGVINGVLEKTYFGGETKFKTIELRYKKTDSELLEFVASEDPRSKIIFKWPVVVGLKWSTKSGGKIFHYEVVALDKAVKVEAGEFKDCVQVKSSIEGLTGATNEYYAPGVGRILVTISTTEGEKRNTELISFQPAVIADIENEDSST